MDKKIYHTYNLINKEFDVVVMTKNEIKQLDKNEHYVVLLSKQHPDHGDGPRGPRKPRVTVNQLAKNMTKLTANVSQLAKEMRNGFKKQEEFNNFVIEQFKAHGWLKEDKN